MRPKKYLYYLSSIIRLLTGFYEWALILRIFLNLPVPEKKFVTLRKMGLRFQVRGKMDIWSIKETFLDRFYEKFGVSLQDGWKIIDIGAGIGEYTLLAAAGFSQNIVHAYEPFPQSSALLEANLALNQAKGVQIYPEAVADQSGTAILDLTSGEPLQFSTQAQEPPPQALRVPTLTLSQVMDRMGNYCDVLKLDCEGAEFAILFSAPQALLDSINHIVMEYHDGVTEYSHADLENYLTGRGFSVKSVPNFVHPELGYLHAARVRQV